MKSAMAALCAFALVLCLSLPKADAGAVFEIREAILGAQYGFEFDDVQNFPDGSIARSGKNGAGKFFATSAIPLAIFTLNKCAAVAVHIHPNAAEELFVLEGKIRIWQFRGEEDGQNVRFVDVPAGKAGYIQQGAYHTVQNLNNGKTRFLQIFDHPQAGAVFAAQALVALPPNLVNAGFGRDVIKAADTAFGAIVRDRTCKYSG